MMRIFPSLLDRRGSAAAEMALVAPLLCTIMLGSVELGSFFYNEHILVKAVRDGARYAARQSFTLYSCSTSTPGGSIVANTRALVRTSLLAGSDRFPDIEDNDITLEVTCKSAQNSQAMTNGIYKGMTSAPIVEVRAQVDYEPVVGAAFGFSGVGMKLNAEQQAAVMGI